MTYQYHSSTAMTLRGGVVDTSFLISLTFCLNVFPKNKHVHYNAQRLGGSPGDGHGLVTA